MQTSKNKNKFLHKVSKYSNIKSKHTGCPVHRQCLTTVNWRAQNILATVYFIRYTDSVSKFFEVVSPCPLLLRIDYLNHLNTFFVFHLKKILVSKIGISSFVSSGFSVLYVSLNFIFNKKRSEQTCLSHTKPFTT